MRISIIHPSRSRPEMARKTFLNWMDKADNLDNIEYILCVDEDDAYFDSYYELFLSELCKINLSNNKSAIEAINNGAKVSTGDLMIVVSDDTDTFQGWDTALLNALEGKEDFIVKCQDGMQPTIITMPLMDRKYYERFGYVYYPKYKHLFCDTEMTAVAHMIGKVIELPLMFRHNHYLTGASKKDAVNEKNDATWKQGETMFHSRLRTNFDLKQEDIVKPYNQIKWR